MENIEKRLIRVAGNVIGSVRGESVDCNILEGEAATTGHRYLNGGRGTWTYFALRDKACTSLRVKASGKDAGANPPWQEVKEVEVLLEGDSELDTLIDTLEFICRTLKERREAKENKKGDGKE